MKIIIENYFFLTIDKKDIFIIYHSNVFNFKFGLKMKFRYLLSYNILTLISYLK